MKKIIIIHIILAFAVCSCNQDFIGFDTSRASLYFTQTNVTKLFYASDSDVLEVDLKINTTGLVAETDRSFVLKVISDSTNAVSGFDYEPLKDSYTFKAGETSASITLKFFKNDSVDVRASRLYLGFEELNGFTPGPLENAYVDIKSSNVIEKPDYWPYQYGQFSPEKYKIFFRLTGFDSFPSASDFESGSVLRMYLISSVTYALKTYWAENEVLDEDGNPVPW